jgi:two-component system response regulator AtoC
MNILVVDDEEIQRTLLKNFLTEQGYNVFEAADGKSAIAELRASHIHLALLDHRMPDMNGDKVLEEMKQINPALRAIMITAYSTEDTAVRVMKLGADDFMEKPVDLELLLEKLQQTETAISVDEDFEIVDRLQEDGGLPVQIIGSSKGMKEAVSIARRIGPAPWAALVTGETGTGKELIARLIHELSDRKKGPFVEVNCAAIPENLFESELFGHVKGAFTGASSQRKGRFEQARGGTLFLDEVGELPEVLQPKLLRALQEKRITPVGSDMEKDIDVRVVAATNRDLKQMAREGKFREDLYYRLNVFEIQIPPLRERKEDLPELIDFFMERYALQKTVFSQPALDMMMKYQYPGNVRELEHIIQRTATLARSGIIKPADLPPEIREGVSAAGQRKNGLEGRIMEVETEEIKRALEENGWVQTRAAESLGISERVLRYKMKKYGIRKG